MTIERLEHDWEVCTRHGRYPKGAWCIPCDAERRWGKKPMTDTAEQCARKFYNTLHANDLNGVAWEALPGEVRDEFRRAMLAANEVHLKAIREPTMDMGLAGAEQINKQMRGPGEPADYDAAMDAWQAMIDQLTADSEAGR